MKLVCTCSLIGIPQISVFSCVAATLDQVENSCLHFGQLIPASKVASCGKEMKSWRRKGHSVRRGQGSSVSRGQGSSVREMKGPGQLCAREEGARAALCGR